MAVHDAMPSFEHYPMLLPYSQLLRHMSHQLFGFDLASRALHPAPQYGQGGGDGTREAHPLFVHFLFVPSFLACSSPSPSLLRLARACHFLPPDGLPSFSASFQPRSPPPLFLSADGLAGGEEWLVVVIERVIVERFGADKVESYQGHMGLDEVKKLFNRARLLIGPSSLALSSLLFLPFNAALLELLPRLLSMPLLLPPHSLGITVNPPCYFNDFVRGMS
ncbi:hypothetical protein CLOP_g5650 [Closterium sp. NIES-67]|nr:hypothetical protein CLOP_g5650 [Closterium sp. NIES-67]